MRFHPAVLALLVVVAAASACGPTRLTVPPMPVSTDHAHAPASTRTPDVIYVPTHEAIVEEMLKIAAVTGNDVLYDLGSGDGRIVIAAAQRLGTRGVGIDIDPARVTEADQNARDARVTDRVRFVQADIFEADISEATVVTLYLSPEVNLRLRPKLLRELRPGTRIVSHDFDLGDWTPERMARVQLPEREHRVYLWRVPPAGTRQ